jgi:DNA-binding transcriptional LysR family regulator
MADWDHFAYVLAVARTGSLAGAARSLKVDRTSVGRHISALEDQLGVPLFTRGSDGLRPTPAGDDAIAAATTMEAAALEVERKIAGAGETIAGKIKLTASEAFSPVLMQMLKDLRTAHPGLTVELVSANRPLDLARGEADLAIRMGGSQDESLVARKIGEMEWWVFGSDGYLETHRTLDYQHHDFVGYDEKLSTTPGAEWIAERGLQDRVVFRGNSIPSILAAARSGVGLAALPAFMGRDDGLTRVGEDIAGLRPCSLVFHTDLRASPRIRTLVEFLVSAFDEQAERLVLRPVGRPPG